MGSVHYNFGTLIVSDPNNVFIVGKLISWLASRTTFGTTSNTALSYAETCVWRNFRWVVSFQLAWIEHITSLRCFRPEISYDRQMLRDVRYISNLVMSCHVCAKAQIGIFKHVYSVCITCNILFSDFRSSSLWPVPGASDLDFRAAEFKRMNQIDPEEVKT